MDIHKRILFKILVVCKSSLDRSVSNGVNSFIYRNIRECYFQKRIELNCKVLSNIYTSISIASISFTGRMKFISRSTPLALSPRKGTENTNDVRNSPLFLECCYFKIASTKFQVILIASPNKFRISQSKNVYLKVLTI